MGVKEVVMKQAMSQLSEYGEKGFKNLQDKLNRVNEQNDQLIDLINEMLKGQVAIWQALKQIHYSDKAAFDKVEKDLKILMEVE